MNPLKFALSTKDTSAKNKPDVDGSLLKGVNKSKNQSLWAFDIDNDEAATEQSLKTDNLMRILNDKLEAAFHRDSKSVSEITFQRVVQQFQDEAGGTKSELSYLLVIEDKLSDILEFAKDDFRRFLDLFSEQLSNKIIKLRKRQKKSELSNFDRIASGNFKKKNQLNTFLTVQGGKQNHKSKDKNKLDSKSPRKDESSENKLKRLFSKDKNTVKERQKGSFLKEEKGNQGVNATALDSKDQSVTFTALLSTSVGIKSRRRKASNQFREKKPKVKKNQNGDEEKEEGQEAFIFFRPKKGKK